MAQFTPIWAKVGASFPDVGKIFQQAQQANATRLQNEKRRYELDAARRRDVLMQKTQDALRELGQAEEGTPQYDKALSKVQTYQPELAGDIKKFNHEQQKFSLKKEKEKNELTIRKNLEGAQMMETLLPNAVVDTPQGPQLNLKALVDIATKAKRYADGDAIDPAQADKLRQLARRGMAAMREGGQPAVDDVIFEVRDMINGAKQSIDFLGDPEKRQRFQPFTEKVAHRVVEMTGDDKALDVQYAAKEYPEEFKSASSFVRGVGFKSAQAAGGIAPTTRGAATAFQKDIIGSKKLLKTYQDINKLAEPWMFSAAGSLGAKGITLLKRLAPGIVPAGLDEPQTRFAMTNLLLDRGFNQYRKKITGAQASFQEIQHLKKSVANGDMDWNTFQVALSTQLKEIQHEIQLYHKALAIGVETGEVMVNGRVSNDAVNAIAADLSASDVEITEQDRSARVTSLEQAGLSEEEQVTALLSEGYISEEEAKSLKEAMGAE